MRRRKEGSAAHEEGSRSASVIAHFAGVLSGADDRVASEPQVVAFLTPQAPSQARASASTRPKDAIHAFPLGSSLALPCVPFFLPLRPFGSSTSLLRPFSVPPVPAGDQRAQLEDHPEIHPR